MPKTNQVLKLSDLSLDKRNANKGTPHGAAMIARSLRDYGAGRSIVLDKNGTVIAGNKTAEGCAAAGIDQVVVVQTTGKQLVAVQRMDLDLADNAAKGLAVADNRTGEVSLAWDLDVLSGLAKEVDLSGLFDADELAPLVSGKARIAEIKERAQPKKYLRILISVGLEDAILVKDSLDALAAVPGIEIDYSAN